MFYVGIAQLLRFVVFLEVVFALRQTETALKGAADHAGTVFGILIRIEAEEHAYASAVQPLRLRLQIRRILDRGNLREFRIERSCSGSVDRRTVHATRVEVADLLFVRTGYRPGVHSGFENLSQVLLILVRQLGKGT